MTEEIRTGKEYATLHEKVLATGDERGLFSHIYRDHFERCPTVDTSSAFTFFWDSDLAPVLEEILLEGTDRDISPPPEAGSSSMTGETLPRTGSVTSREPHNIRPPGENVPRPEGGGPVYG